MRFPLWTLVAVAASPVSSFSQITEFRPFAERGYAHVNAHQLSPDGRTLYVALFPERVAAEQGVPVRADAPEVAIYFATATDSGWSTPQPISFSGPYKDYEPTLSPDGELLLFNSWRPMPDGRDVDGKNNLWLSRRANDGWTEPVLLAGASRLETEESYPAIDREGRVYYMQETIGADGEPSRYDVYTGSLRGDRLENIQPFAPAATDAGEGDPWVSSDGSIVVFTRWEHGGDWHRTCQLYVTSREGDGWSEPVVFPHNVPEGPDFSPTASPDGETFYWKAPGGTKAVPMTVLRRALAGRRRSPAGGER